MLNHPKTKYRPFAPTEIRDRTWPDNHLTQPPIWLSTDLRDGNQALIDPMSIEQKLQLFQLLVEIGFKEIEVAFPSASQTEFDFVRSLIEQQLIPEDVTIQVLTPSRPHLIRRTFEALQGSPRAIVHLYNATDPVFRRVVFRLDEAGTIDLAVSGAKLVADLAAQQPETAWRFQYSPEIFTTTELTFAKDICDAVLEAWQPTPERKAIINLPASVEVSTPNGFADRIEWMHRYLTWRDRVVLSVHPHNDRGTAIAAAELAQLAGAERVEGCLFGNGERTGNVDLVTLALNLYTQGIHPRLDFSDINRVARVAESCTQLPIHPRHPYVGDLVFTAFSGSHQDAIKKGMAVQQADAPWQVPYLPMDPADVGRTYESVIRVNSQSGKGGMAFLLERDYGLVMPRRLQIDFSQAVQRVMDAGGQEMTSQQLWQIFCQEYLQHQAPFRYERHQLLDSGKASDAQQITATIQFNGQAFPIAGCGNGPIDAFLDALDLQVQVQHYEERSLEGGSDAAAIALVELAGDFIPGSVFGAGIHENIVTASLLAILSAVNRSVQRLDDRQRHVLLQRFEQVLVA